MADKIQILKKGAFFMDEIDIQKQCQTYEVTDFQHNFEIEHPITTLQQWRLIDPGKCGVLDLRKKKET